MVIYKTTNTVNGKIYIGKDVRNRNSYLGSGKYLHNAISKYGRDKFVKEILEYCETKAELCEREKFYIKQFNSRHRDIGYNIAKGGEGGDTLSAHPLKRDIFKRQQKARKRHEDEHPDIRLRRTTSRLSTEAANPSIRIKCWT